MNGFESLYNFREVATETLYRSGQPDQTFLSFLKEKYKIRSIVDLRSKVEDFEKEFATSNRIHLLHIPLKPFFQNPKEKDILSFLELFEDSKNCPALVHCLEGKNRTGIMVALFRLLRQDWPMEKVIPEMKENKTNIYWQFFLKLNRNKLRRVKARL